MSSVCSPSNPSSERLPLWNPSAASIESSNMMAFINFVRISLNDPHLFQTDVYPSLWQWSVDNIDLFWKLVLEFTGLVVSSREQQVFQIGMDTKSSTFIGTKWFVGAKLNVVETFLKHRFSSTLAIISECEGLKRKETLTYVELYDQVCRMSAWMRSIGVKKGDRCAAVLPNIPSAIVAMLSAASIGAVWSSCSPDFGANAIIDRFGQIAPKVIFVCEGYFYKGKCVDVVEKVVSVISGIPSISNIVLVSVAKTENDPMLAIPESITWDSIITSFETTPDITFEQVEFSDPLFIMFSSGTTGLPKCIVQGSGVILNHMKELILHCDIKSSDCMFYYTTVGWMMWNWSVSILTTGATLVLFDGNPLYPEPDALWKFCERYGVTVFGTSAKYLSLVQEMHIVPLSSCNLSSIRLILSTGSLLAPHQFEYIYRDCCPNAQLASISGGTDLNGCFVLGCPLLPVFSGELQCRGLGMDVDIWSDDEVPRKNLVDEKGELVCLKPFPSMPLQFWNDPSGKLYKAAYFSKWPNVCVWYHGDYALKTHRDTIVMCGRSDATLNPGGVCIGTAELYNYISRECPEVVDSVVIGQRSNSDERVVLFVQLHDQETLTSEYISKLKKGITTGVSPRHCPAEIRQVPGIPYTINGKKMELVVKNIVEGNVIKNLSVVANPEILEFFSPKLLNL